MSKTWFVLRFNHFDPIWRRCWERDSFDAGRRIAPYRAIEEAWLDDVLQISEDGVSCFMVESAWVLRSYLERHPEHLTTFCRLTNEGRFELLGSGENIVDTNMVHGETLVRNLVIGTLWAERTLGLRPSTGWLSDAFGSSAQIPQIFRRCGYRWIPSISYNIPDAPYWRGLDGSTVLYEVPGRFDVRSGTKSNVYVKHAPCPKCSGEGCEACDNLGFIENPRAELDSLPDGPPNGDAGVLMLWGEEIWPGLHVSEVIKRISTQNIRQGTYYDLAIFVSEELAGVDDAPESQISSKVENNPCHTGCYVTRIRCKQDHRAAEHALLSAECWDTLLNNGGRSAEIRDLWRKMTLSAFHDAITGTHIDDAHTELLDLLADVTNSSSKIANEAQLCVVQPEEGTYTIFNSQSFPASAPVTVTVPYEWAGASVTSGGEPLPAYEVMYQDGFTDVTFLSPTVPASGAASVCLVEAPARVEPVNERVITCGDITMECGEHGIESVSVDGIGKVTSEDFYLAEPILEHDFGDPWCTRSLDRTRERLSQYTRFVGAERHSDSLVIRYAGSHPSSRVLDSADPEVNFLEWRQSFKLRAGVPWIEVETEVDWYTYNRRLRLAFPSVTEENRGVFDIPYGVLERDWYEPTSVHFANLGGDWPAVHWGGIQASGYTFAVFNQGTPSYRIEDGTVFVSVLRSPTIPACLLEPWSYPAHNFQGMMDHGTHTFRHALYIGKGDWRENDVVQDAVLFNAGLSVQPGKLRSGMPDWRLDADHTLITSVKSAEDGNGVVLRLVECAGKPEKIHLHVPETFKTVFETNLLEEIIRPLGWDSAGFVLDIAPWKIATVRIIK